MTTAHRPTFDPARGGTGRGEQDLSKYSKQYSSKDLPSHTKLKYRQHGQESSDDVKSKDLRKDLDEKEKAVTGREKRTNAKDAQSSVAGGSTAKKRADDSYASNLDADDPVDVEDDEDVDSDEDDTAELMAELNRIKKEREEEKMKKEAEEQEEEEKIRTESILSGNPLLNGGVGAKQDFKVKRRWDDDVVFKNCAKGVDEKKKKQSQEFINDALRSEFHKKFMEKYIK